MFGKIIRNAFYLFLACKVAFIACYYLRTILKLAAEYGKLFIYFVKIVYRVSALAARNIYNVQKQAAALNMAQKLVA